MNTSPESFSLLDTHEICYCSYVKTFCLLAALISAQLAIAQVPPGEVIGLGAVTVPPGLTNVVALAAHGLDNGCGFSVAVKTDGTVTAWGYNYEGQTTVPAGLDNVVAVAAGGHHVLALRGNGTVIAWGGNQYGQTNVPLGLCNVAAIAAGHAQSLALLSNGTVVVWGYAGMNFTNVAEGFTNVIGIAAGGSANLALFRNGTVVEWNAVGIRETIPGLTNVVSISGATGSRLALKSDGSVIGWGWKYSSEQFITNFCSSPRKTIAIGAGYGLGFAIQDNGNVAAWHTGLGLPVELPDEFTNIVAITGGFDHIVAIKTALTVPDIHLMGVSPVIRFQTVGGQTYSLLYSSDLKEWTPLPGGEVVGNGAECQVTDTNAVQMIARRFYRLKTP